MKNEDGVEERRGRRGKEEGDGEEGCLDCSAMSQRRRKAMKIKEEEEKKTESSNKKQKERSLITKRSKSKKG